jgi:hypothetical protein
MLQFNKMKPFIVIPLLSYLAFGRTQEERFVDNFIAAQRKAEHAAAASEIAGLKLQQYCALTGRKVQVKQNGLIGCVVPPLPATPPAPKSVK